MVVDGEVVAFDGAQTRFERLQQRLGLVSPPQRLLDEIPVYYYLFDVLYADGRDTRALPVTERKRLLAELIDFRDPLRFTEGRVGTARPSGNRPARTAGRGWSSSGRTPPTWPAAPGPG